VTYPPLALCTDNGAMIALAGALRLQAGLADWRPAALGERQFGVRPRWDLATDDADDATAPGGAPGPAPAPRRR